MNKRLFVGSLPYSTTSEQLTELFSQAGKVELADVIVDKFSGRGRGFAFVEMTTEEEAEKAIKMLNGYAIEGRTIIVNEARPMEARDDRGGGYRSGDRGGDRRGRRDFSRNRR